ncbi:MAG TPA: muconolactone Delta-isomerase family protein [Conexibacter sp.]|nr:muconolactone Delta-isomerase family protein [Conexibacter sp.]
MADWLVEIDVRLPPELDPARRAELLEAERVRGRELLAEGSLREIWRLPGRSANVGVWRAEDATALHAAIASLPCHPWMQVRVTALALHPLRGG